MDSGQKGKSEEPDTGDETRFASRLPLPVSRLSPPAPPLSPLAVTCPFCGGADVELFSLFGSQLLTSEYYCRNCRTVFENLKR